MISEERKELGEKLKKVRVEKKVTLDAIADETKINIHFLEKIEQGDFEFLPQPYVKSFIKSYIHKIGDNPHKYLETYEKIISGNQDSNNGVENSADNEKATNSFFSKIKSLFISSTFNKYILLGIPFLVLVLILSTMN